MSDDLKWTLFQNNLMGGYILAREGNLHFYFSVQKSFKILLSACMENILNDEKSIEMYLCSARDWDRNRIAWGNP